MSTPQKNENGFILKGKISDFVSRKTKGNKDMFTYFVFTGRQVYHVRSMQNNAKVGDTFNSRVNIKPYVSKNGIPGIEIDFDIVRQIDLEIRLFIRNVSSSISRSRQGS